MDQVSAVAEEQRRTHQSFAKIKRLEHFIAGWWLFTLEGEGERERERERQRGGGGRGEGEREREREKEGEGGERGKEGDGRNNEMGESKVRNGVGGMVSVMHRWHQTH